MLVFGSAKGFGHLWRLSKLCSASAANQVISSGTSFAVGLYLSKVLSPSQFGLYGLGFSAVLFVAGVLSACVTTQMVVNLPERRVSVQAEYAARMLALLVLILAGLLLLTMLVVFGSSIFLPTNSRFWYGLVVALASASYVFRDFFVRYAYSTRSEGMPIVIHLVVALVAAVGLISLGITGIELSALSAIIVFAIAHATGALAGLVLVRLPVGKLSSKSLGVDAKEAWRNGRWALGGAGVVWLQSQAYLYIAAALLGLNGAGLVNAAKILVSPIQFLMPAVTQLVLPRLATARVEAPRSLFRIARYYVFGAAGLASLYLVLLAATFSDVNRLLLGDKYRNLGAIVACWGVVLLAQVVRDASSITLQALKLFDKITVANMASATLALVASYLLCLQFGAQGAVLGVGVGETALAFALWRVVTRMERRSNYSGCAN